MDHPAARPWLRHVGNATRAVVHRGVDEIAAAVEDGSFQSLLDVDGDGVELLVKEGVGTMDGTSSALCTLRGSILDLRVPATADRNNDFLCVIGCKVAAHGTTPLTSLRSTLELWRTGLSAVIGHDEEIAAGRVRDGCVALLRAAAQTFDPAWSAAAFASHGPGIHDVLVECGAAAPTRFRLFTSDRHALPNDTMFPELARAFDNLVGTGVHVSKVQRSARHLLPMIQIGPAPAVRIVNHGDAMSMIRATAALPARAQLVPGRRRRSGRT